MSVLDDQLKELQGRKLKVEFFTLLKSKIGDIAETKFKEVEKEIKDDIFSFIDAQIDLIESGTVKSKGELDTLFSEDQVKALMLLADKVQNKVSPGNPYNQDPANPAPKTPPAPNLDKQDKISFALAHQKLGGKEVSVRSMGNAKGTVTGIDAPHIVVQLVNGSYIKTAPEDIIV